MRTFGKKNIPRILRCWRDLLFKAIGEFVYGAAAHDMVCYTIRLRAETENIFMLAILGDLIGLPIMPPYYALRLLPYMVPQIETWKRRVLREKDFLETEGLELVG